MFQIGLPPRRIDIMTTITGVGSEEARETRSEGTYGGVGFPIIGIDG